MIEVTVHLKDQSQPIVYKSVVNTYEKGSFYCVYCEGETVYKHPIADIWRVKEGYGAHGSGQEGSIANYPEVSRTHDAQGRGQE